MQDNGTMKATTWQPGPRTGRSPALWGAALLAASVLTQCASLPPEDPPQPAPPANYGALVATALKGFKTFASYSNFQISPPRWVHAETGWSWLVCVRYDDQKLTQFYSFFIEDNSVVNARYDVRTDRCAAQQYVPFNITTGTMGSPAQFTRQPIY